MGTQKETFIKFEGSRIHFGFYYHTIQDGDKFLVYIPAYDTFVPASSKAEAKERSKTAVISFFKYWTITEGRKRFLLQIHKLGFRAPMHDLTLKRLLNGENMNTSFKPNTNLLPKAFEGSEAACEEGELAYA